MPIYNSSEEMQSVLEEMFERLQGTPTSAAIAKAKLTVGFNYTDPDVYFILDGKTPPEGKTLGLYFGKENSAAAPKPDVTFSLNSDVGHRSGNDQRNVPQAMSRGQVKATGSIAKALKLLPLLPPVYETYSSILTERGRAGDLA